ncbi:MAG: DUF3035 domain-containing protein [Paracoccaceae bacterium]
MRAGLVKAGSILAVSLMLAGCSGGKAPRLMPFSGGTGPDEFAIVPNKPLEEPKSYTELPEPTPGAKNLVDPTPNEDAVVALGGRASALNKSGTEGGIVNYASRYGRDDNVRADLAENDLAFRKRNKSGLLDRLFGRNIYQQVYKRERLDAHAEQRRLRRSGVLTPTSPPEGHSDQ